MQRILLALALTWFGLGVKPVQACDACGCSLLLSNWGPVDGMQRSFVGWRAQTQGYTSYADAAQREAGLVGSREAFGLLEIRAGLALGKRSMLTLSIPYVFLHREVGETHFRDHGLADASLQIQRVWWQSPASARWSQQLLGGVVLKAPTGRFAADNNNLAANPNFQRGSGSWDAGIFAQYLVRSSRWAASVDLLARRNTANADDYRFGSRLAGNVRLFGLFAKGRSGLTPYVGWNWEYAARDVQRGFYRAHSGGQFHFAQLGAQWNRPRHSIEVSGQIPAIARWADKLVQPRGRLTLQWVHFF